jgi:tRNA threonylcarbamoyladenosine biosynthesis protein TsaB
VEWLTPATRHDDDLLPAIERLMKRTGAKPRDLAAVAVSIGPGGFTGLRIAVSTAKMLAEALPVRLVAVPTALVVAESLGNAARGPLLVTLACKRDTMWLTRLERDQDAWRITGSPGLVQAGQVGPAGAAVVIGDEHLPAVFRERCISAGVEIIAPRFDPAACWRIGARMLASGNVVSASELLPLYAREPEAVSLWKARAEPRPT